MLLLSAEAITQHPTCCVVTCSDVPTEDRLITLADPFAIWHEKRLYVFAEIEGYRVSGAYFKSIGCWEIIEHNAHYLGEVWPTDGRGHFSYPYIWRGDNGYYMLPDCVDTNSEGHELNRKTPLLFCPTEHFPMGWVAHNEFSFPDIQAATDKVYFSHEGYHWLFISDAHRGGKLEMFFAPIQNTVWQRHPKSPILKRSVMDRLINRFLPMRFCTNPYWRLGGRPFLTHGSITLPIQHSWRNKVYGEAVSSLVLTELTPENIGFELSSSPLLLPSDSVDWACTGTHHFAPIPHENGTHVTLTIDGFNGEKWAFAVVEKADDIIGSAIQPMTMEAAC